jgi:hypothetical protein
VWRGRALCGLTSVCTRSILPPDENEEEFEIELNEEEPAFLKGQTKQALDLSPVKVVKVRRRGRSRRGRPQLA